MRIDVIRKQNFATTTSILPMHPRHWSKNAPGRPKLSAPPRGACRRQSAQIAHLALQIVLQADLVQQADLRFQEIDVFFGVVQNALQQVA